MSWISFKIKDDHTIDEWLINLDHGLLIKKHDERGRFIIKFFRSQNEGKDLSFNSEKERDEEYEKLRSRLCTND
jgi:hypothetical protein